MELRSVLHAKPIITITVAVILVIGALALTLAAGHGSTRKSQYVNPGNYYTADEGQTWIADTWALAPPFERDGKTWLRVYLFAGDDKTPVVGYLEKYTEAARQEILSEEEPQMQRARISDMADRGLLIKRPGDSEWLAKDSGTAEVSAILNVVSPKTHQLAKPLIPDLGQAK